VDYETVQMMDDVAREHHFEDRHVLKPVEVGHHSSTAVEEVGVEEAVDDSKDMTLNTIHLTYVVQESLYSDYEVMEGSPFASAINGRSDVEIVVGDSSVAEEAAVFAMTHLEAAQDLYSSVGNGCHLAD